MLFCICISQGAKMNFIHLYIILYILCEDNSGYPWLSLSFSFNIWTRLHNQIKMLVVKMCFVVLRVQELSGFYVLCVCLGGAGIEWFLCVVCLFGGWGIH